MAWGPGWLRARGGFFWRKRRGGRSALSLWTGVPSRGGERPPYRGCYIGGPGASSGTFSHRPGKLPRLSRPPRQTEPPSSWDRGAEGETPAPHTGRPAPDTAGPLPGQEGRAGGRRPLPDLLSLRTAVDMVSGGRNGLQLIRFQQGSEWAPPGHQGASGRYPSGRGPIGVAGSTCHPWRL